MNKHRFMQIATAACLAGQWGNTALADVSRPNIVYILADDMGSGDVSAYNAEGKISTPHIDRLAREGMKFMDAHTNASVCTPTRYGIMTGRYCWRTHKKEGVLGGHCPPLIPPSRETVASFLKKEGYRTACIGKWHLGMDWANTAPADAKRITAKYVDPKVPAQNGPNALGFDYFFGTASSLNHDPHAFIENGAILGELEYVKSGQPMTDRNLPTGRGGWVAKGFVREQVLTTLAEKASGWITQNATAPFFLYLPLTSPHNPICPRPEFQGKSGIGPHGDFVMETDWVVGEVLKTLDRLNLTENTLVVFTTDNGTSPSAGITAMAKLGHHTSWIYRGCKGTTWEGGHRVPFVVRWPEIVTPRGEDRQAICTTDLLATCADIVGQKLPDQAGEDSVSFLPALKGQPIPGVNERVIVHHSDEGIFALRKGKWKLMLDNQGGSPRGKGEQKNNPVANSAEVLLFDMDTDAIESTNLSGAKPEVLESMKQALADVIKNGRSTPGAPQENDPLPAGKEWNQLDPIRSYL